MSAPLQYLVPGTVVRLKHSRRLVTVETIIPALGVVTCYWYEHNERRSDHFRASDIELLTEDSSAAEAN